MKQNIALSKNFIQKIFNLHYNNKPQITTWQNILIDI